MLALASNGGAASERLATSQKQNRARRVLFFCKLSPKLSRCEGWEVNPSRAGWVTRAEGKEGRGRDGVPVEIQQSES